MKNAPRTSLFSWLFRRDKSQATSALAPTTGATATGNNAAMPTGPDTDRVTAEVSAQELVLLYFNEPIAAIKAYRERTGVDLKTAKTAIDAAAAEVAAGRVPVVVPSSAGAASSLPTPNSEEIELVAAGKPIAAIKAYRERTGADLKTAKAAIDAVGGK